MQLFGMPSAALMFSHVCGWQVIPTSKQPSSEAWQGRESPRDAHPVPGMEVNVAILVEGIA